MRVLALILLMNSFVGFGQQDPFFVSDGFTPLWTNPASTGSWNKFSANLVGRLQWPGVNGAPSSAMLNSEYSFQLKNDHSLNVGIDLILEEIGQGAAVKQNSQIFSVPINYSIKLKESRLAFGLSTGFRRISFSQDAPLIPPQSSTDPILPVASAGTVFSLDAGVFWSSSKFYLGLSSTQLTAPFFPNISFNGATHYYLQAGYRFKVGQHYIFPQVNLKSDGAGLAFWNLNYFQFKEDIFSIGAGFSAGRELLLAATFRYKRFKIAYNFDLNFGPLSGYTAGSHEVRLSFAVPKGKKTIVETVY